MGTVTFSRFFSTGCAASGRTVLGEAFEQGARKSWRFDAVGSPWDGSKKVWAEDHDAELALADS
jgi:hypothetical protein